LQQIEFSGLPLDIFCACSKFWTVRSRRFSSNARTCNTEPVP